MAEREEKYIVIKKKDYEELRRKAYTGDIHIPNEVRICNALKQIVHFEAVLLKLDNHNEYIVINQDEPYANAIWDLILAFETMKAGPNDEHTKDP